MLSIGSLFTGVGGIELGLESLGLGPVVWQAERDPYAYGVLECRWPDAIRFRDVRRIDATAPPVDLICGGFPCQDISVAGKGAGLAGKRSGLWGEFARIIRDVRPRFVFVENVAALRSRGLDRVLGDLAALGFDAEWLCLRASDVGAPHIRQRLFLLAYADGGAVRQLAEWFEQRQAISGLAVAGEHGAGELADASRERRDEGVAESGTQRGAIADGGGGERVGLADASGERQQARSDGRESAGAAERPDADGGGESLHLADADGAGRSQQRSAQPGELESPRRRLADRRGAERHEHRFPQGPSRIGEWDGPQPALRRGADGLSRRVDRLRCLGNAVVPQQAALAFATLAARAARSEAT